MPTESLSPNSSAGIKGDSMSVPNSKGGRNHKAMHLKRQIQYPLIKKGHLPRSPSGYDSNAQDNDALTVVTAKLRKAARDAFFADDEDRGGNKDDRATDNYALDEDDDARVIAEEDDPERGTSQPEDEEGNVAKADLETEYLFGEMTPCVVG